MPTMTIKPSDGHIFKAWTFAKWQRDWRRRQRRAARIIYKALCAGSKVTEEWHNRETIWPDAATRTFIPECQNPEYLTGHIVSRMFGFSLTVRIEGGTHANQH